VAVLRGRPGISAGNLVGSDLFNLLGVLGVAGAVRALTVQPAAFGSLLVLCGLVVLVVVIMRTGWKVSRLEGGMLVAISLFRWYFDLARNTLQ
jgi:cation:H+ antiporter